MPQSAPEQVVNYVRSSPEFVIYDTIDGQYNHIGATVADAILQANNRYKTHVKPRVDMILRVYPETQTTTSVLHLLNDISATEFLNWKGKDRAERFCCVLHLFASENVESEADLKDWLLNGSDLSKLLSIKGIGAKTVDYFKILVGLPAIAVDRHLLNFLELVGLEPGGYEKAQSTLNSAADILSIRPAYFDHSIWQFMSKRPKGTGNECQSSTPKLSANRL
jgi:endonuclease III